MRDVGGTHPVKDVRTVLDFVGHQRTDFRFYQRFRMQLGGTRPELEKQIQDDFPFLPASCTISLDKISKLAVLQNIQAGRPKKKGSERARGCGLGFFSRSHRIRAFGYNSSKHYYTELRRAAGHLLGEVGSDEHTLGRAIGRMLHVDDHHLPTYFMKLLNADTPPVSADLPANVRRLATQFHYLIRGGKQGIVDTRWVETPVEL